MSVRRHRRGEQGFTVIELIMAIVVMALVMPALMQLFTGTVISAARGDRLPTAVALGNELMEEIKSRKFDQFDTKNANGNWTTPLGPQGYEVGVKANFNDVDDFNGWTQTFSAPFNSYSASVTVSYVAGNNLNNPLTIPSPVPNNWTPSYKRIVVTVTNAALPAPVTLTSVVTEVQSL